MIANVLGVSSASLIIVLATFHQMDRDRTRVLLTDRPKSQRRDLLTVAGSAMGRVPMLGNLVKDETQGANLVLTLIMTGVACAVSVKLAIPVFLAMMLRTRFAA